MPTETRTNRKKTDTVSIKGVACAKCGCRKFRPLGGADNGRCVHCGTFTILWGAF